jgi:hypothetical protein
MARFARLRGPLATALITNAPALAVGDAEVRRKRSIGGCSHSEHPSNQ